MPFEKFLPPQRRRGHEATIRTTGTISIPRAFAVAHGLAEAAFVTIHFDRDRKLVGVKAAADPAEEGALRIAHRRRASSIRARSLFDHYRIPLAETRRCPIDFDAALGMAVIALKGIKRLPGRRRTRS